MISKQISSRKLNQSCRQYPVYNWDGITHSEHTCVKLYTLIRTERTKTIPCPAAHPRIGYIYKGVPPPQLRFSGGPVKVQGPESFKGQLPLTLG